MNQIEHTTLRNAPCHLFLTSTLSRWSTHFAQLFTVKSDWNLNEIHFSARCTRRKATRFDVRICNLIHRCSDLNGMGKIEMRKLLDNTYTFTHNWSQKRTAREVHVLFSDRTDGTAAMTVAAKRTLTVRRINPMTATVKRERRRMKIQNRRKRATTNWTKVKTRLFRCRCDFLFASY